MANHPPINQLQLYLHRERLERKARMAVPGSKAYLDARRELDILPEPDQTIYSKSLPGYSPTGCGNWTLHHTNPTQTSNRTFNSNDQPTLPPLAAADPKDPQYQLNKANADALVIQQQLKLAQDELEFAKLKVRLSAGAARPRIRQPVPSSEPVKVTRRLLFAEPSTVPYKDHAHPNMRLPKRTEQ